ncbi:MAG: T9SS type A sorting domain-containing protein [Paludibacteraceae bacterium]|nr:T9SS type A sorting domain-containing protein [Paludibacteraceae bacterium]
MRRIWSFILMSCLCHILLAQTEVTITDTENWQYTSLKSYVGQTIRFDVPFYVCNNYSSNLTISPHRIFSPTNQALPLSSEYNSILSANKYGAITLTNVSGYHRMGERLHNLIVKVNSQNSVSLVSCDWQGNTRADLQDGPNLNMIDMRGKHSLLVCCMNLEYYLVETWGDRSMGPASPAEHQKQREKVSKALAKINADLYGFVEIEQGQSALAEIASDLSNKTGRHFTYIDDGGLPDGTYTKAGFVYCSDILEPYGKLRNNNKGVTNRKKTQAFIDKASGEKFLFSVNHFKAKSGNGSGLNADQGDGQGGYNYARVEEAESVLNNYQKDKAYFGDDDILIMGDLNAYAMEDPITTLREGGMIDLHRTFHADSSYSYNYRGAVGYLDHALCNTTLLPQITGMLAYHINSDESDNYTYDKSDDESMFRCSDHDPIIVGLRLDSTLTYVPELLVNEAKLYYTDGIPHISNADGGAYALYTLDGQAVTTQPVNITSNNYPIYGLRQGLYIINIYANGKCLQAKLIISSF